ncbi:MAG: hypothetical protein JST09_02890 [Bacteroidetes bacterium]|nr:hypothetical protein [Bacteroidota bacterium]
MGKDYFLKRIPLFLLFVFLFSCNAGHDQSELIRCMKTYDRLLVKMDTDSLSQLYAPDGQLGDIAKGPDSIRKFLLKFADFRVLSNESLTDSILLHGDSAFQAGKYHQVTILPNKDTSNLHGRFEANWIYLPGGGWKIRKMVTKPL